MALQLIPLGPPAFDSFTPLSQIGQSFFKQYDDGRKRKLEDDFAKSNADLIGGMTGPAAPAAAPQGGTLGEMGKPSRALPTFASDLTNGINQANAKYGLDPSYLPRLAQIESGGNINAKNPNSTAEGPFQFIRSTAAQYGLTNPRDPMQAADAAARLALDNKNALTRALGRDPSPGELYLAHQQGAGGAIKLLTNPNAPASAVVGEQAVALNGGRPGMTAGQFASQWVNKFGGGQPVQVASAAPGLGYAPDTRPQPPPMQGPPMAASFGEAVPGVAQPQGMPFASMPAPQASAPVQRPPMSLGGGMPQSGGVAPAQPAPQQMAQAGPSAAADPFGFSRMPPQVAAGVKSLLRNPLPAAQARGMAIVEMYKKTEQWSGPVTDPRTGAEFQVNRVTGERKIFQQPQDNFTVETDGRGNMVQVNTRTNQRSILDKAEGWQSFKGEDGNTYAWNPRNPQSKPVVIGQASGYRDLVTPEERLAAGIDPTDKRPVQRAPNNKMEFPSKAQTEVNLNNAGEKELDKGFAGTTVKRYSAFIDKADQSRGMLSDISTLREISRRVGSQGKTAEVKMALGPYAEALGIDVKDLSDLQAADAVIQRLAPQMHVPGSGATSDIEFKGFVKSLGSMTNNPQAREMIYDTFEAFARYDIERGEIASAFANKEISRTDAEKQIKALGDPLTRYREWKKTQGSTETAAPEVAPPSKRVPLPDGYSAPRMVNEAKRALKVAPGAKSEIADKLRSHGIDPKVLD